MSDQFLDEILSNTTTTEGPKGSSVAHSRAELKAFKGKRAWCNLDGLNVPVEIKEAKRAYGHTRYLVQPICPRSMDRVGEASTWTKWINHDKLTLVAE